jgi:hypothetical protein
LGVIAYVGEKLEEREGDKILEVDSFTPRLGLGLLDVIALVALKELFPAA